jgi:hypothetical protein
MVKGNKGEWSEVYALLKLLAEKKLVAADAELQKVEEIFYPILKIIRQEASGKIDYQFLEEGVIKISSNGLEVALVDDADLTSKIRAIFDAIKSNTETTFKIPVAEELMGRLAVTRLNAGNAQKEDITLQIHDRNTGAEPEVGFSIKSKLGSPATLLNASSATNFVYAVSGISDANMSEINAIDTSSKVKDRVSSILAHGGKLSFQSVSSEIFSKNLRKVDTVLPEIIAALLLAYYTNNGTLLANLVDTEKTEILNFHLDASDYEFKIKSLLHNVALGMVPNTPWDGLLRAHGGYIIVREDGELVCYHVYNADDFRNYLFKNTKFETPSTSRHDFGFLYKHDNEMYIKLNFQIRFI